MARKDWIVARTPEELAEALYLPPSEAQAWRFRRALADRIAQEVARRKLTHAQAAKLAGTSRSRMTAIVNGGHRRHFHGLVAPDAGQPRHPCKTDLLPRRLAIS